ncbi:MAG: ATP-binding protein [Clostridia bacterium]|nr:ATP-binding protein [Clostridia bacterium]
MKKYVSEIFLTTDFVNEDEWLKFILEISRLNGIFNKWKIVIEIERNLVKYYIITKRKIPTILGVSGSFFIKNIDNIENQKTKLYPVYMVKNNENNIVEIYEKSEAKYNKKVKRIEIKIIPFKQNNYITKTHLYFGNDEKIFYKRKAVFFIPHIAISIDYTKHNRFLYKKDGVKYLKIQKSVKIFNKEKNNDDILEINAFPYFEEKYYLNINDYDFNKHSLIVGASGSGKSKLIASFIERIYENKAIRDDYKIVVIDPHSSLEEDIGGMESLKIIDMKSTETSMNLLSNKSENVSSNTEILMTIFKTILGEEYNSRLERVLRHSIYLLLKEKLLSFENLRKLLSQSEYRNKLVKDSEDIEVHIKEFFLTDFKEIKSSSYQEAISPIIAIIDEMQMLPGFKEGKDINDFEDTIEKNFSTIFSINQAVLGEKVTKIISGLIMGLMFSLVQRRRFDKNIIFIIDEIAVVENPILISLLSEARKYNLSLIVSGQYLGQVSKELRDAIFTNVYNYYSFRISREDAMLLNNHMQMEMAVKNTYNNRIKLLTELPNRECIVRISKNGILIPAFRCKTLDFRPIPKEKNQILHKIVRESILKKDIEIKEFNFEIGDDIDIKSIMSSQSTSRRKIKYE